MRDLTRERTCESSAVKTSRCGVRRRDVVESVPHIRAKRAHPRPLSTHCPAPQLLRRRLLGCESAAKQRGVQAVPTRPVRQTLAACSLATFVGVLAAGCATQPVSEEFRSAYGNARDALEAGDYESALGLYAALLPIAGSERLEITVRLDYAHALLRAGRFDRALVEARGIEALGPDTETSGRVDVVVAVAEHEIAERVVGRDVHYETKRASVQAAFRSLDHALRNDPRLDPEGVLIIRMRKVREMLAALEIEQLRTNLEVGATAVARSRAANILRDFGDTTAVSDARTLLRRARTVE